MYEYDALKEHLVESDEIMKETMRYLIKSDMEQ